MSFKTKGFYKIVVWVVIVSQLSFVFLFPKNVSAEIDLSDLTISNLADAAVRNPIITAVGAVVVAAIGVALGGDGASVLSSSNMNGVMSDMEKRYHINPTSVQNFGETMNTSTNKELAPQVNLFFNPTDPQSGKEITAQAFPLYFSGEKESLYFTWYLKRKECDLKSGSLTADEKTCDLDNTGSITINDWKIQAMRRIANSGFSGDQVDYTQNSNDDDGYKAQFGGDKSKSDHCYVHDFSSGEDYELYSNSSNSGLCKHLFPKSSEDVTGNGSFGKDEEKFWHTDPQDPSTAQNGNKDEANVVGLNQDKFTWNYASGDEVGVAIEGLSMAPTKYQDASMKVMWAFAKNKCVPTGIGSPIAGAAFNGGNASIPTANMDLNDCISDNLVDPTQGDQAGKLEVQMTTTPSNPSIDSFSKTEPDNRGDVLTAQSMLVNSATKYSQVSYEWRVYASSKQSQTDDEAWEDITQGLVDAHAISTVKGSDLASLRINLNIDDQTKVNGQDLFTRYFKDGTGYFRINLTATENFDVGKKRVGRASTVVKLVRAQAQIQTHAVKVDTTNGKLKFATPVASDTGLLCEDTVVDRTVCPVVKGQIIGLNFDASKLGLQSGNGADISWILNNKPLRCTDAVSKDVDCASGKENFFPVTGDVGESYAVSMTASNPLTGKSITLKRMFRIVAPSLLIVSTDSSKVWPKYLGQYTSANGNTTDNFSQNIFSTFSGGTFTLKGLFYPNSLKSDARAAWSVNDVAAVPDTNGLLTVQATRGVGSVYSVSLKGAYTPSPQIKKALSDIWGISIADVTETNISRDVQVEITKSVDGIAMGPLNTSKKFFASLVSYVPASVIFVFRLMVTMGLILLTLGVVFSFVPEKKRA